MMSAADDSARIPDVLPPLLYKWQEMVTRCLSLLQSMAPTLPNKGKGSLNFTVWVLSPVLFFFFLFVVTQQVRAAILSYME